MRTSRSHRPNLKKAVGQRERVCWRWKVPTKKSRGSVTTFTSARRTPKPPRYFHLQTTQTAQPTIISPRKHNVLQLETMTSGGASNVVARGYSQDSSNARDGDSDKNRSDHKKMIEDHESPFDSSDGEDDNDDEGGIPAWVAMRRSQRAQRIASKNQRALGPSSAGVTVGIFEHNRSSVHAGQTEEDKDTLTVVNLECDSESSGNQDELTPSTTDTVVNLKRDSESSGNRDEPTPTTSEFEPYPYLEGESSSIASSPARISLSDISNIKRGPQDYVEYYSGACKVMRGGFKLIEQEIRPKAIDTDRFLTYPPTSNCGYMLTSTSHDPKFVLETEQANATFIPRSCIMALRSSLLKSKPSDSTPPDQALALESPGDEDQRVDSDGEVSEGGSSGGRGQYARGWVCSLGERDTCGSSLPDWFPAEKCEYPWLYYTDLLNDIHRLESLERGFTTPSPRWNRIYHTEHPVWAALGLEMGGWWRCRSGPNAPYAERMCYDCHIKLPVGDSRYAHDKFSNYETMAVAMVTLRELREFVDTRMHGVAQRDRVIALDMIRDTMNSTVVTSQTDLHAFGIGRACHVQNGKGIEEEQPPRTKERVMLEAVWDHQGPVSNLVIPESPLNFGGFPDQDVDNGYEDDGDSGMMMMPTTRHRPPRLSFHRSTSSIGSNFLSSLMGSLTPRTPLSPGIPEEDGQLAEE